MINSKLISLLLIMFHFTLSGQINPTSQNWIKTNSYEISLNDTLNYKDLNFLKGLLKDKKIVFLGENAHGVSEFTTIKSRLIRFLHENMGFDVLAFESNFADAFAANRLIRESDVLTSIYNSISLLWHVEEIVPLFNYIKETHSSANPLNVAGVDLNLCNASYAFARLLYNLLYPIDSIYAKKVYKNDSLYVRMGVRRWMGVADKEEIKHINEFNAEQSEFYSGVINFIDAHKDELPQNRILSLENVRICLQTRRDFPDWRKNDTVFMAEKLPLRGKSWDSYKLWNRYRDFIMAQYLKILVDKMYPEKKIIVWAENSHISRTLYRMASDPSYSKSVYSIEILCYSGKGRDWPEFNKNDLISKTYDFKTPVDSNSVENILHQSDFENTFVNMQNQIKSAGNSWMFETVKTSGWDGSDPGEVTIIKNSWDGIILIDKISPPKYLKYKYEFLND